MSKKIRNQTKRWTTCVVLFSLAVVLTTQAVAELGNYEGFGLEGPNEGADYTMKYVNRSSLPSGWDSAVLLPYEVPEYHWWQGCSPTAAGMLFAYWDTYLGKDNLYTFYDGDSSYWDTVHMNASYENNYGRNGVYPSRATHSIVASWEHHQAGQALGLTYGSWDRNGNGIVDTSDREQWNSLADFMRTQDGGTSRGNMAQGFIDYAAWDDPETPTSEAYYANSWTQGNENWAEYTSEINNGYPVHVGIPGHSILGFGYWDDPNGVYGEPHTQYVVNMTTWASSAGKFGLIEFSEVYAYTLLRVGDSVVPINEVPVAINDAYTLDEDTIVNTYAYNGVLANDSDPEGDPITSFKLSEPAHGTVAVGANGWFTYVPDDNYHGTDSFTYQAFDGQSYSDPATVNLDIVSINDVPIAVDDAYSIDENEVLHTYVYNGVLSNDTDADNTDLDTDHNDTLSAILETGPAHGQLTLGASGWFTYTPETGFDGTDSFTYSVFDGTDYSELGTVLIDVLAALQIPGDATGDGVVDKADSLRLAANWGQASADWSMGDFDGDHVVGPKDAAILAAHWGYSTPSEATAVPEPSSLALLLMLAVCVGSLHRQRSDF
ncbi:MAG: tandem-95 repeat protein [Pirellulales bacterium]|nr:tandem-95 repeat protein [Pirellulales bacterium]